MAQAGAHAGHYDTEYRRSLRHYITREALPSEANYRNLSSVHNGPGRLTLDDLHYSTYKPQQQAGDRPEGDVEEQGKVKGKVIKFGWKQGVLMRCMLNIWGVMLFLRLSWMVGQAGLMESIGIVCLGNGVTIITAISMSAVATNGLISGGGVYYMISRSLGPEFGGSIGLMFTIANSIAVATYIIGFVESLQDMLFFYFDEATIMDGDVNAIRAVGTGVLVVLMVLAIVGMDWVTRVQMGLLFLLIGSQVDVLIGCFIGPMDDESMARGFVGWNGELFSANAYRDYRYYDGVDQNFISVFAVFFTAVTGIVAGANLSGDLKDPRSAIPKGTLLAIGITFCSYILYPFFLAANVVRDASGDVEAFRAFYYNDTDFLNGRKSILEAPVFTECSTTGHPIKTDDNITIPVCEFGLENSSQVMELVAGWGPLIYLGCFAATLSSAIASLVGAPRVLQALAKDRLYPGIFMFSKGFGANNDPVNGYCLVFVLSFLCIMIGNLNAVSTLLSNFFLASYSLINFSCFHASLVKSPGWRPSYTYYNMWVSLFGGLLCLVVMFLIDYITALVTFIVTIALYLFVSYRKPDVNWGSSAQGSVYVTALKSALTLQSVEDHVKNYRPQVLVMSGKPSSRPPLLDFASLITKNLGVMVCAEVTDALELKQRTQYVASCNSWLVKKNYKAFYSVMEAKDFDTGAISLFQLVGLGKLKPNVVLMGFKSDWNRCSNHHLLAYFNTLHAAFSLQLGVCILRLPNGLDYSNILQDEDSLNKSEAPSDKNKAAESNKENNLSTEYRGPGGAALSSEVLNSITTFKQKRTGGTIDVWWLYDDGGLTLLLPYLLTKRSTWGACKLRIFALANRRDELDMEQRSMANLLSKFRIDYGDVIVIPDAMRRAGDQSRKEFDCLIEKFKTSEKSPSDGVSISEEELAQQNDKINRHIRLQELLKENSASANLIIMTMPMPRKGHLSAALYMAWLDYMSKDMPPVLFVRGNQQSVLTFYM